MDHYLDLVRSLGAFNSDPEISLHLPEQIGSSLSFLKRELSLPSRYFVLHPGSARAEKYWVAARWAEVIAYAHARFKIACVITGGRDPGELQHIEDILLKSSEGSVIFNLAGKIDLLLAAALIEHAFFSLESIRSQRILLRRFAGLQSHCSDRQTLFIGILAIPAQLFSEQVSRVRLRILIRSKSGRL